MRKVWQFEPVCDCEYCRLRGHRGNAHAWAFFYFLRRAGDKPRITVSDDGVTIRIEDGTT